jgi:hypothetical protein
MQMPAKRQDGTFPLPHLGTVHVTPDCHEPGHWLGLGLMGWHDCTREEDRLIAAEIPAEIPAAKDASSLSVSWAGLWIQA